MVSNMVWSFYHYLVYHQKPQDEAIAVFNLLNSTRYHLLCAYVVVLKKIAKGLGLEK